MSVIATEIYLDEAGVHHNPALGVYYETHCDNGPEGIIKKTFQEVLIHWDADLLIWVIDPIYVPGQSIPALEVINPCTGQPAYLNYPLSDFRIAQACCRDEQSQDDIFVNQFVGPFV